MIYFGGQGRQCWKFSGDVRWERPVKEEKSRGGTLGHMRGAREKIFVFRGHLEGKWASKSGTASNWERDRGSR